MHTVPCAWCGKRHKKRAPGGCELLLRGYVCGIPEVEEAVQTIALWRAKLHDDEWARGRGIVVLD